jgi:UDP-3-O-[3-hydroxymyristoyl] glucosamine N-acyltransferase
MKKLQSNISPDCTIHSSVVIVEPVNIYGAYLSEDVFVGPFVEIQSEVHIGKHTRIQSHSFICSLVNIGQSCFIGHSVTFVNDKFSFGKPAQGNSDLYERTILCDRVYVGSGSTILPVSICSDVVIGAGSVVTRDILIPGTYAGNPARKLK